jgi:CRISPR-associated protein Csd2
VHDSLKISLKENVMIPSSVEDYNIVLEDLPDLKPEIIEGI